MVRAVACHVKGQGFKSLILRHLLIVFCALDPGLANANFADGYATGLSRCSNYSETEEVTKLKKQIEKLEEEIKKCKECQKSKNAKIVDYMIIREECLGETFYEKIYKALSAGWQPFGSVAFGIHGIRSQVMVKYEE